MLKGLGVAVGLPSLEAMLPRVAVGASPAVQWPKRLAFFYIPNGVHMDDWKPIKIGKEYRLPATLKPVESLREKMNILSGLTLNTARANGDGAGDHARSAAAFLTGRQPYKTDGSNIKIGVSVDQAAARILGRETRFPSLEVGIERGLNAGGCDSGYSCAYSSNISWRAESTPSAKEVDPKLVFERLFGDGSKESQDARKRRDQYQQSILDFVLEDAKAIEPKISGADRRKLDEYFTGVREIEQRVRHFANAKPVDRPNIAIPGETPDDPAEHIRLLGDLVVLAFQTDLTRVTTFMFANEGSNRSYKMIDVREGHHSLSHHENNQEKIRKIAKINLYHMSQLAYILDRMDAVKEGDATLLDHSLVVYGSGIGDGNRHNHDDLPILSFGGLGGTIQTGEHRQYRDETPLCNFYLSILQQLGIPAESFGDSTGPLKDVMAA